AVFVVPVTVAVNPCVLPTCTVADVGDTVTLTGDTSVTTACANFVVSAADVARIVTWVDVGMDPGAVYMPAVVIVPAAADPPTVPFTAHVTAPFVVPVTDAVNA